MRKIDLILFNIKLSILYWKYLLGKSSGDLGIIKTALCRARGHPNGVVWYNFCGSEPDMHCKDCGDNLG